MANKHLQNLMTSVQQGAITPEILIAELQNIQKQFEDQEEMIEHLRQESMLDALTGAMNKKGLDLELRKSLANAQRHKRLHTVLFFKLEGFDALQEKAPYAADEALCHVYELLKANTRQTDVIARLQAENFCILLNDVRSVEDAAKRGGILTHLVASSPLHMERENLWLQATVQTQAFENNDHMADVLTTIAAITKKHI